MPLSFITQILYFTRFSQHQLKYLWSMIWKSLKAFNNLTIMCSLTIYLGTKLVLLIFFIKYIDYGVTFDNIIIRQSLTKYHKRGKWKEKVENKPQKEMEEWLHCHGNFDFYYKPYIFMNFINKIGIGYTHFFQVDYGNLRWNIMILLWHSL